MTDWGHFRHENTNPQRIAHEHPGGFVATYVRFAPRAAEDVEAAEQASDYVNYIINQRNDGYKLLHTFFKDALLFRMGVVKFFYEEKEQVDEEEYNGCFQ